jgi:hypothetical protein
MASEPKRATSPALVGAGLVVAIILIAVAFAADAEYGWPLLILALICLVAALGYRAITARGGGDADSTDSIPHQEPRGERPLGDTPEVHDEINPHDLPRDNPGREEAEELAGGADGTTRGPLAGG